jgi:e3 binding domain
MAAKTTSQRSSSRRSQSGASRNGKQNGDGLRPAQQARREINEADREYRKYVHEEEKDRVGPPDVVLDVPELRVDSIHFELDDLDAHLALKARVLNLVKLNVGIDIHLSRVKLDVKGVEAEVVLKARLDHVTAIVDRLMTSLDRNPELVKGLSKAVSEVGRGAGEAVDKTGDAAKDIGKGAQSTLTDVGQGAGQAVGDVGQGAGQAVGDVGQGAGQAVGNLDQVVGGLEQTVGQAGQAVGQAVGGVGQAPTQNGGAQGQPNGATPPAPRPGTVAKEVAKLVAREIGHAASDEARDVSLAAARKVRELGERREQRRADKYKATEAAMRVADELGIDLASLDGTGSDGRITVKDVREAQEA